MPPEKKVGGVLASVWVTEVFEGMHAGGAAAGGAGVGGGTNKTHMRRRQREAERAKRAQLAGEIDGRSRGGRELGAAAAGDEQQQWARSSSVA